MRKTLLSQWGEMFFGFMKEKIEKRRRQGWHGWGQISEKRLTERLIDNARRKDWVDVANLALLLWIKQAKQGKKP